MFNNSVLDVVIGLVFIFLLYSLLATTMQEVISTIFHRRANTLYDGIKGMLSNTKKDKGTIGNLLRYIFVGLSEDFWKLLNKLFTGKKDESALHSMFYDHPIIKNYGQNLLFKKPSYLTAENFSSILIETLKNLDPKNADATATFALIRSVVESNQSKIDKDTRNIINYHLNEAAGDLNVFKYRLDRWYNNTMDRVSGWYKRNTQFYLLFIGLYLAVSLNIDTIEITNYLSDNKTAREQLARMGEAAAANPNNSGGDAKIAKETLDSIKASINKVNTIVGLGWGDYGSSDTAYRHDRLKDSSAKIFQAFIYNKDSAVKIFNKNFNSDSVLMTTDTTMNQSMVNNWLDSLKTNRNEIISQIQFSLLYTDKNFENDLRIGYVWKESWHWKKLFGFLITALAISLGAPFWFDLLNKVVSIRTAVKTVNSSGSTTKNNSSDNDETDG